MIILLDEYISCEKFSFINSIDEVKDTLSNSTVMLNFDKELMLYCIQNNIQYGVNTQTIKEVIYANGLGARYILPTNTLLKTSQKLADNYMFDSKIIAKITNENEIEKYAIDEIDGVIFYDKLEIDICQK